MKSIKRPLPILFLLLASVATAQGEQTLSHPNSATSEKVSGIDQSLFSDSVKPGENFYLYANQKWLDETPIPPDKADYGIFTVLDDTTREQVRKLIDQAAAENAPTGTPAQKVGDMYRSVLDVPARNKAGITPIEPLLAKVDSIESASDLASAMGWLAQRGIYGPMAAYVGVDAKKSDQYIVYLTQSGLTLPDRDYYLEDDERYATLRDELQTYMKDMLTAVNAADPASAAEQVFAIEKEIAQRQWTKTENRDPEKTYNLKTKAEVDELVANFPTQNTIDAAGLSDQDKLVVRQPSYFEALDEVLTQQPVAAWKQYLKFQIIDGYASSLTEDLERRHFEFHGKAVSGTDEQQPMWKRAVDATGSVLGEVVGQLYVEKHFAPQAKARMNELVENLKRAFAQRIESREWMSKGTQKQALQKLAKFTTKIGYPDEWKDYSDLTIIEGSPATNMIAAAQFEYNRDLKKLGGPIDRNEWHMTPQTINAYYNPTMNEIVFPAAILQPPFFNMAADDAVNYGGIGAVIGHELSHGFDDKGSKYDGDGNLRNWWTPTDREEFEQRASGLVDQYSEFQPFDDMNVNGELTLGENIGDLGGLAVSYAAYQLSLEGKAAPVIDELTGDQRFFLGWSQIWRRLYREQELRKRLITDPHSPSEYRVNGIVRNMDAWYDAFNVDKDAPLYIAPEDRIRIW
ncbi:endothelin-converting enzyme Metallo peptidase. MEROPS family M13 [Neorhodopirellula lusitana]|uniref:Endothelin-converting enzyme Metallo peptidase. MEROPS family M13 n=1 Tax=Neorhodopirellula lusitana TaxID=445327 RepID=A0ABY1QAM9_9BACT|nr:M13 family metallopeptidase [Neorhodopirellula lusitana]SMP65771.1 endothelin-converting enzyme Metallo peptidase. MEROPS family M13 [Neorhodopirellula lusitana]